MATAHEVSLHRVYDLTATTQEKKILVDRVWPRGVKKESLHLDRWIRDIAPSNELRKWFGHKISRWPEFERRYRIELEEPPRRELVEEVAALAGDGPITLLYGARDEGHNQAVVLRSVIEERLAGKAGGT
jgi:uncharacterized protein YeaO (DUF488 family)